MWQLSSGAFLGWALGSNDAANVFATGVSTGMVRFRTATILIAIFVILGAVLEGPRCMQTLGQLSSLQPSMAFWATLSAGIVMFIMSAKGLPASSSQAIVGALFALGLINDSADFGVLGSILLAWVLTPVCAGLLSMALYLLLGFLLRPLLTRLLWRTPVLRIGIVLAGCYGSYALGGNNVANVSGPFVSAGVLNPLQGSIFGGLAIAAGVLTYSKKVMLTVGQGIYALDAFSAFITVFALALSSHLFTWIGVPVSSTQAVVGAVIGIGLLKGMKGMDRRTVERILLGWVATPIIAGLVCILLYFAFDLFLTV